MKAAFRNFRKATRNSAEARRIYDAGRRLDSHLIRDIGLGHGRIPAWA